MMERKRVPDYAARAERLKEVTDKLENGIQELYSSGRYAAYLQTMSKFHRYSFGNVVLIFCQCPGATQVAGFHDWKKKFGRSVKPGEHGIQIFAPCTYTKWEERDKTDPATQQPILDTSGKTVKEAVAVRRQGYKVEYVFDVSQTEGRELPTIACELSGDVAQYEAICAALRDLSPVPIDFQPLSNGAKGCFSSLERKITVQPDMSQSQTLKTLIHEIAHAKLHALPVEDGKIAAPHEKDRHTRDGRQVWPCPLSPGIPQLYQGQHDIRAVRLLP
jgi:hypothetical protein